MSVVLHEGDLVVSILSMISGFTIDGFKAFRHAEVPLRPLTLVYGQNSAGKSTIIEALHIAYAGVRCHLIETPLVEGNQWRRFDEAKDALAHKGTHSPFFFRVKYDDEEIGVGYWPDQIADLPQLFLAPRASFAALLRDMEDPELFEDEDALGDVEDNSDDGRLTEFLSRVVAAASSSIPESADAPESLLDELDPAVPPLALSLRLVPDPTGEEDSIAFVGGRYPRTGWDHPAETPADVSVFGNPPTDAEQRLLAFVLTGYFMALRATDAGAERFMAYCANEVVPAIARIHDFMTDQVWDDLYIRRDTLQLDWASNLHWGRCCLSDFPSVEYTDDDGKQHSATLPIADYEFSVDTKGRRRLVLRTSISSDGAALDDPQYAIGDALRMCLLDDLNDRLDVALTPFRAPWITIGPVRRRPGWFEDIERTTPSLANLADDVEQSLIGSSLPWVSGYPSVGDEGHHFPAVVDANRHNGLEHRVNECLRSLDIPYRYANGEPEKIFEEGQYGSRTLRATRFRPRLYDERREDEDGDPIEVSFQDVGYGLNQVLPIIVQLCAPLPPNAVVTIQQPELHIHPKLQTEMADLFLEASMTRVNEPAIPAKQVIIETHSEHILLRIQRRIREGKVDPSHVAVLYVDTDENGESVVHHIRLGDKGEFLDEWPDGFFGERLMEILGY